MINPIKNEKKAKKELIFFKTVNITVNMGGGVVSPCTLPCCGSACPGSG